MPYTTDDKGILNNFAIEPKVYVSKYPSSVEQRRYMWQGALATLLILGALVTAVVVS